MALAATRSHIADSIASVYVKNPCRCYCICVWVLVLLSMVSLILGCMTLKEQKDAWMMWDHHATQVFKASDYARLQAENVGNTLVLTTGGRRLEYQNQTTEPSGVIQDDVHVARRLPEMPGDDEDGEVYLFYKVDGGNVFTPAALLQMCQLELLIANHLRSRGDMALTQLDTSLRFFYGSATRDGGSPASTYFERDNSFFNTLLQWDQGCYEIEQIRIDRVLAEISEDIKRLGRYSVYAGYVTRDFAENGRRMNSLTTTKVVGAADMLEDLVEMARTKVSLSYGFLQSAFQTDDADRFANYGTLRIRIAYADLDESWMLVMDLCLASFSFLVVFLVMWLYTQSVFLAFSGMLQMMLSMPISGLLYRGLFGVKYFYVLHSMVVFLLLGIGAHNIFVLVDTFVHAEREEAEKVPRWSEDRFKAAFRTAYVRTAGATFGTSITVAAAFLSTSISEVMPIYTCGWYAAICILMNYVFTITLAPAALAIWHLRFQGKKCCCLMPSWSWREEETPAKGARQQQQYQQQQLEVDSPKLGRVELALRRGYIPLMSAQTGVVRPVPLTIIVIGCILLLQGTVFTAHLTFPSEPEVWLPTNHMSRDIEGFFPSASYSPDYNQYALINVIWGVSGLNRENLDIYEPDTMRGAAIFDPLFSVDSIQGQEAVLEACRSLRRVPCHRGGCHNAGSGLLMIDHAEQQWSCFMEDFHKWLAFTYPNQHGVNNAATWPTGSDFRSKLRDFRSDATSRDLSGCCAISKVTPDNYNEDIGFINGELKYVKIRIRSTIPTELAYRDGIEVRKLVDAWLHEEQVRMPQGMRSMEYHTNGLFAHYDLNRELECGFYHSLYIALPAVFLAMFLSTWNIIVSAYALLSVYSVVVCVLGFCHAYFGWELGFGEAIAGVVVLGYSVDYVMHLAHFYCEAQDVSTRDERCKFAIHNMGTTILAGALSTGGSGIVLFFCFFAFFFKMAIVITLTIMFALLFSLGFMMSLLWLIGPEGHAGDVAHYLCVPCSHVREEKHKEKEKEKDNEKGRDRVNKRANKVQKEEEDDDYACV